MRRIGVALVALGVVMLGWAAWQYWGTTWQSQQRHDELTGELEEGWRSGDRVARVDEGVATAVVRIRAFGADYAVPLLEGTSDDALAAGFGHLDGTADPGAVGNFAIAGHRVTHGEPLADMPSLDPGDRVIVDTATHTYTYVLDTGGDDLTVSFDQTWVLDPLPTNPEAGWRPTGPATRTTPAHPHDLRRALPHRRPAGGVRPSRLECSSPMSSGRYAGLFRRTLKNEGRRPAPNPRFRCSRHRQERGQRGLQPSGRRSVLSFPAGTSRA